MARRRSPPPWPPYQVRAYQQTTLEQIKENQATFKEDLDQVKGDVSSMKGDLSQVLLALKNIIDRQDQLPMVAFEEVAQTIGASSGHQLRKELEEGPQKFVMAQRP